MTASRRLGNWANRPSCGPSRRRRRPTPSSGSRSSSRRCLKIVARAGLAGTLPRLVARADLRGDCHSHSDWSDGVHTIEQMAESARRRGYSYLVLTDHTISLAIARGLSLERGEIQRGIVAGLNARSEAEEADGTAPVETPAEGFRLLHGCEL